MRIPTGTVTLDFTSFDLSECFPSPPTSLTFDTTNWNVAFVITFNVTDTLRAELNIDRVNAPDGTVNISGQTVSVTFATIQPGQTFQFSIFTTVTEGVTVDNTACVQAAGIATECTTAPAVSSLPSTGETPSWATLLRGLVVVLLVGSGWWALFRQAMPKSTDH